MMRMENSQDTKNKSRKKGRNKGRSVTLSLQEFVAQHDKKIGASAAAGDVDAMPEDVRRAIEEADEMERQQRMLLEHYNEQQRLLLLLQQQEQKETEGNEDGSSSSAAAIATLTEQMERDMESTDACLARELQQEEIDMHNTAHTHNDPTKDILVKRYKQDSSRSKVVVDYAGTAKYDLSSNSPRERVLYSAWDAEEYDSDDDGDYDDYYNGYYENDDDGGGGEYQEEDGEEGDWRGGGVTSSSSSSGARVRAKAAVSAEGGREGEEGGDQVHRVQAQEQGPEPEQQKQQQLHSQQQKKKNTGGKKKQVSFGPQQYLDDSSPSGGSGYGQTRRSSLQSTLMPDIPGEVDDISLSGNMSSKIYQPISNRMQKLDSRINLQYIIPDTQKFSQGAFSSMNKKDMAAMQSSARYAQKSDRATVELVLDPRTRLILFKMINSGIVESINGCVSTGKEANVYHAVSPDDKHLAIKIYKTSILVFKDRDRYVSGEYRFRRGYSKSNPRKMVRVWAEKEMRNLKRLHTIGINCPEPLMVRQNVLLMTFIGSSKGWPAPRLKDVDLPVDKWRELYVDVIKVQNGLLMCEMCGTCILTPVLTC